MQTFKLANHEDSLLPDGNWALVWNDEFDGTELDRSKWDYRLSMMGEDFPARTDKGVHLDGKGNAVFTIVDVDGRPVSSQLQTGYNFMDQPTIKTQCFSDCLQWKIGKLKRSLYTHTYGYYECRCRLQQHPEAWWSAFWMQSPIIGASLDPAESGSELDIMECFSLNTVHRHCVHTGGYGQDLCTASAGGRSDLDQTVFHRFGMLWDETGYTFYVDGVEDGKVTKSISRRPEFILISTEVKGYRKEKRTAVPEARDAIGKDDFLVDYVRVFDKL